jgi:hypothetical protein
LFHFSIATHDKYKKVSTVGGGWGFLVYRRCRKRGVIAPGAPGSSGQAWDWVGGAGALDQGERGRETTVRILMREA